MYRYLKFDVPIHGVMSDWSKMVWKCTDTLMRCTDTWVQKRDVPVLRNGVPIHVWQIFFLDLVRWNIWVRKDVQGTKYIPPSTMPLNYPPHSITPVPYGLKWDSMILGQWTGSRGTHIWFIHAKNLPHIISKLFVCSFQLTCWGTMIIIDLRNTI